VARRTPRRRICDPSSVPPAGSDRAEYRQTLQYWVRLDRIFILAAALLAFAPGARGHDIPDEVRVQAFVKPESRTLELLVRVPLKAVRDVDVPQRRGGFLDFTRVDTALRDAVALWLAGEIELYEDDARLGKPKLVDARVSLESDRSFASYASALAHFKEPRLGNDTELYWNQGLLDVLLEYPIRSERSAFSIRPRLERLGIKVNIVLRFLLPGGEARAFDLHGDRGLDLLHGDRERPRQQPAAALDHRLRLRPGARLRLRLRPAAAPAVRRLPPSHLAPRL